MENISVNSNTNILKKLLEIDQKLDSDCFAIPMEWSISQQIIEIFKLKVVICAMHSLRILRK